MFFKTDPYDLEINIIYYSVTQKYKSYNLFKLLDSNKLDIKLSRDGIIYLVTNEFLFYKEIIFIVKQLYQEN